MRTEYDANFVSLQQSLFQTLWGPAVGSLNCVDVCSAVDGLNMPLYQVNINGKTLNVDRLWLTF